MISERFKEVSALIPNSNSFMALHEPNDPHFVNIKELINKTMFFFSIGKSKFKADHKTSIIVMSREISGRSGRGFEDLVKEIERFF